MEAEQIGERFERGLKVRREVLGADYVANSLQGASEFTEPLQVLVTEICWGDIWTRPGLERRTRSLLNLVMLTALNRSHELAAHVRGAVVNGVSELEIQEALLQTAVYVGVPAALESFRVADRVLADMRDNADSADGTEPAAGRATNTSLANGTGDVS